MLNAKKHKLDEDLLAFLKLYYYYYYYVVIFIIIIIIISTSIN